MTFYIELYLYIGYSCRRESYLGSKYAYYSVEVYRFFKKPIVDKLVSVQTVNAKCGIQDQRVEILKENLRCVASSIKKSGQVRLTDYIQL